MFQKWISLAAPVARVSSPFAQAKRNSLLQNAEAKAKFGAAAQAAKRGEAAMPARGHVAFFERNGTICQQLLLTCESDRRAAGRRVRPFGALAVKMSARNLPASGRRECAEQRVEQRGKHSSTGMDTDESHSTVAPRTRDSQNSPLHTRTQAATTSQPQRAGLERLRREGG